VETISTTKDEVSKIQPLEIEPHIELMEEEEVKTTKTNIQVKTTKPEVGTKPLVIV
jgi:hypothetical protein